MKYFLIFNLFLIIIMGIFEFKNIKVFFIWTIIIFIFSLLGFLAYIIFGNALKFKSKKIIQEKYKSTRKYLSKTNLSLKQKEAEIFMPAKFVFKNFKADLWHNNKIKIFTNGEDFFNELIIDILNAKVNIHLEFYIFGDDITGKKLSDILIKKSKEGIKIKIIYDAFGCKAIKQNFWNNLKKHGIEVVAFFPPLFKLAFLNIKINYRNHRKIAIIDGKIAYTGGINLRDDHMNKNRKLFPWRDTQIKIIGTATYALQDIFLNDFCFCNNCEIGHEEINSFFPEQLNHTGYTMQILESDICTSKNYIYNTYIHFINNAKKFIYIQTPYFVVDNKLINLLIDAKKRGVNVNIIIPKIPDKKIIYGATLINIKQLINNGINIYLYKGFIHSKVILSENFISIGTCNFDNRSFFLNFENTCLLYDKTFINKNIDIITNDIKNSELLTIKHYYKLKTKNIFSILFYKVISKFV